MTRDQAVELVVASLPYPSQITAWDSETEDGYLRFTWRGTRYRFSYKTSWLVEEVGDGVLIGSDAALLVEHLIKLTYLHRPSLRVSPSQEAGKP